jgi:hypothetical protein
VESSGYAAPAAYGAGIQTFLQRVFLWMFAGLLTTAVVAGLVGSSNSLMTSITESPGIVTVVFIGQLALVFALVAGINRMSASTALALFFVYSATVGITFAMIFELYTKQSIFSTFAITAAMFGSLALIGYTTKKDLTKLGPILFAALIALIVATVVNIFVASSSLYWITTYAGVLIFAGLTVYDMQKIRKIGEQGIGGEQESKLAIMGALALYLDFINMFLFLLRIFGNAR